MSQGLIKIFKLLWYLEFLIIFFQSMHQKNIQKLCACTWGLLGPQWTRAYYLNVLLMHTFERKLSKLSNITEYSSKQTEIWLIDWLRQKRSELKTQFYTIWLLERSFGVPKDPNGLLRKVYGLGRAGLMLPERVNCLMVVNSLILFVPSISWKKY